MIKINPVNADKTKVPYRKSVHKKVIARINNVKKYFNLIQKDEQEIIKTINAIKPKHRKVALEYLKCFPINLKVDNQALSSITKPSKADITIIEKLITTLNANTTYEILGWEPNSQIKNCNAFYKLFPKGSKNLVNRIIKRIFDYKTLITKKIAYDLTIGLDIKACTYCNRVAIDTVVSNDEGVIRPELDHFYSQDKFPLLALTFYNLIPSCTYCNTSIKGKIEFHYNTHIHPYYEGFDPEVVFDFEFNEIESEISSPNNFTIKFNKIADIKNQKYKRIHGNTKKDIGSIPTLKLVEIYQSQREYLGELYVKCDKNSEYYIRTIQPYLDSLNTTKEEFYKTLFQNHYEVEKMNLRPLSKFTRDIIFKLIPDLKK